jgi:hypothetical protein
MSDLKQMELLKCLYKAQVELGNAYQCCEDKMMKADLWEEYLTDIGALPIGENDNLLEQFGFIYDEPTGKWIAIKESETIYLKRDGDKYDIFTHGEDGVYGKVEYVHQLQNFVYDKLEIELR